MFTSCLTDLLFQKCDGWCVYVCVYVCVVCCVLYKTSYSRNDVVVTFAILTKKRSICN